MMAVTGLQSGVLYNVTVTPCACGSQGIALHVLVRTGKICASNQSEVGATIFVISCRMMNNFRFNNNITVR